MENKLIECPYCGEIIYTDAKQCRYCKRRLSHLFKENNSDNIDSDSEKNKNDQFVHESSSFQEIFDEMLADYKKLFFDIVEYLKRVIVYGLASIVAVLVIVAAFSLVLFAIIALIPTSVDAYAKENNTIVCSSPIVTMCNKKLAILTPIKVYKNRYKKNGFLKTDKGEYIKETSIVYADSDEYKQLKNKIEKEKKDKGSVKQISYIEEQELDKFERIVLNKVTEKFKKTRGKIFTSHNIVNNVFYNFYINPQIWYSLEYKERQKLLSECVAYCSIKSILKDKNYNKTKGNGHYMFCAAATQILSSNNGQKLAGMENGEIFVSDIGNNNAIYKLEDFIIPDLNNDLYSNSDISIDVAECFKQIKKAEKIFKNNSDSIPSEKNDKNFEDFLYRYWQVISVINENATDGISQLHYDEANGTNNPKMWSTKAKNLVKYYKQNGVGVSFDEGYFIAVVDKEYLKTFYKYLTPQYIKWLDFDKKIQTEVGIQDNCHRKLYEIVEEGKSYYNK